RLMDIDVLFVARQRALVVLVGGLNTDLHTIAPRVGEPPRNVAVDELRVNEAAEGQTDFALVSSRELFNPILVDRKDIVAKIDHANAEALFGVLELLDAVRDAALAHELTATIPRQLGEEAVEAEGAAVRASPPGHHAVLAGEIDTALPQLLVG